MGLVLLPQAATAQSLAPAFSKSFSPDTIGPGSVTVLTFTIDNSDGAGPVGEIQFSDTLPAGVSIATPSNAGTTCSRGLVTAPGGGSTIDFTDGGVDAGVICTVSVTVTSSTPGSHLNVSGAMTSDAGNSGSAADTLTVDAALPGFAKAFSPDTISPGGTSTLTFTIDNTAGAGAVSSLAFSDTLPAGVVIASPAVASTTCTGGTITASSGSGTVSYSGGSVAAASACTLQVNVTSSTPGTHLNVSGDLTSVAGNSGGASDTLMVTQPPRPPGLFKSFVPDTITAGSTTTLRLVIDHTSGTVGATNLMLTDSLPSQVVVASPANATTSCTGGTLTASPGTGLVSYTGGSVAAGISCTVEVDVTSSAVGSHLNTTDDLTSSLGNGGSASDTLMVTPAPVPTAGVWALTLLAIVLAYAGLRGLGVRLADRA